MLDSSRRFHNNDGSGSHKVRSEAELNVISYAKHLLTNQDYALQAIRTRNIRIKELLAEIDHHKYAYEELSKVYLTLLEKNQELTILVKSLNEIINEKDDTIEFKEQNITQLKEMFKQYDDVIDAAIKQENSRMKKIQFIEKHIPKKLQFIFIVANSPFLLKTILFVAFVVLSVSSVIGWNWVVSLFKLF